MANYISATRTNYFKIKDESLWEPWVETLQAEDCVNDFTFTDDDGAIWHGFGCYGEVYFEDVWECGDVATFGMLQEMLPDGEACIVFNAGWEKLRYVGGHALVITNDEIENIDLTDCALKFARKMLGNDEYETRTNY